MATTYKQDLVENLVKAGYAPKNAAKAVNDVFDAIQKNLKKGNTVCITGFGKFYVNSVKKHKIMGINGKPMEIPKHKVVRFTAGEELKKNITKKK